MNDLETYQANVEKLEKSPVFTMSLGSKELFHSNFWAFLMERKDYRPFLDQLFPELEPSEAIQIKREYKNRDIVILHKDKEFVIENKIKSYPDLEQLKRYGDDPNMALGIVTGINKPPFDLPEKWRYVSYSKIAAILRNVITDDKYLESIVSDYCDVLDSIYCLMNLSLKETEGKLSYWTPSISMLDRIRLMDVFRKLKADDFAIECKDIERKMSDMVKQHNGWEFYISRSFHNGKATLSFELLKYVDKAYQGQIGIQIEDNQFRLFLGVAEDKKKDVNTIFNMGINSGWFDKTFDKKHNRKIFAHSTSMSKNPCNYSGRWVYQYFDTWTKDGESLQDYKVLKSLISEYLEKAISILDVVDSELLLG